MRTVTDFRHETYNHNAENEGYDPIPIMRPSATGKKYHAECVIEDRPPFGVCPYPRFDRRVTLCRIRKVRVAYAPSRVAHPSKVSQRQA
ncbi:MAG: hypothetical protein FWE94_02460 [Coriobacteriia bacterium]|nr:hypothetical protein [Coriobacteriia bacterium]